MSKILVKRIQISVLILFLAIGLIHLSGCEETKAKEQLTGKTAQEITAMMGIGWNLGNTLDATGGSRANVYSQETSWGNPKVTPELIKAIQDKGFNTIRIPVTWMNHISKDGTYTIDDAFIARVKEVVDYAYDLDMFVIINLHHESWVNSSKLDTDYIKIGEELAAVWTRIAEEFADYDQHLIFEGMNEPRMAGTAQEWSGNKNAYTAVNYLDQIFTYTVRSSKKGYNSERCLMIPGYAASSSLEILNSISIPTFESEAVKNIIVSVHAYTPYSFCLSDDQMDFDLNNKMDTGSIDVVFKNLEEIFLFNDIPVVIGETGVTNKDNTEARENWAEYMGLKACEYGIPVILWDNGAYGNSGGECHAWINRKTCEWNFPTVIDKFLFGTKTREWGERAFTDKLAYEMTLEDEGIIGGNVIFSDKEGRTVAGIEFSHAQPISIDVIRSYIVAANDLAIAYTGNGSPLLGFSASGEETLLSGGVKPYKETEINGIKIAYFKYRDIMSLLSANDVNSAAKVTKMYIFSDGPDILIYEADTVYLSPSVTYYVLGQSFSAEKNVTLPEGMGILGWYTTKDYQPDTELVDEPYKPTSVYGKQFLTADETAYAQYLADHPEGDGKDDPGVSDPSGDTGNGNTENDGKDPNGSVEDPDANTQSGNNEPSGSENNISDPASSNDNSQNENTAKNYGNDQSDSGKWLIIILVAAGVLVLSTVTVIAVKKSKKKKD